MKPGFKLIVFFFVNVFATLINAQTLTVSNAHLNFGNAFENAPDSLQLMITNNIGRSVTVTGIKFYETYGSPAFSASSTWFTIANGSSNSIWIKFSPRHNIYHNSEMVIENDGLRGYISVDVTGQGKYSDHYYDQTENQSEENLKSAINLITGNNYNSLGYNVARDSMFMSVDNKKTNGQGASQNTLECVYTGREAIGYIDRTDCQNNFSFNTEHTFPQSFFSSMEPMKSDLHHLFPTDNAANNERADNPFGVVSNPSWSSGGSFSDGTLFEPRDVHKGEVARALFYFVLRYQNYSNFLNSQEAILRTWHHNFPPANIERVRNNAIYGIQQNKNPFVDYPVLLDRITSVSTLSVAPVLNNIDLTEDTIIFGTVQPAAPAIFNYVIVNNGNTDIHFTNFALTHPSELTFASTGNDTVIAAGESLSLQIRCTTTTTDSIRAFLSFNTDAAGQASVSIPVFVNDIVFTNVNEVAREINISPVPAHDYLLVSSFNNFIGCSWTIFDIAGGKVASSVLNESGRIDIRNLKQGIYLFMLSGRNGNVTRKIITE